ncbi:MAG: bifunctional UDP-N-acetylglucosamine diphosphorylase/glucosamine-1-phosphate N-acetyltransferase GlmU [Myxococcaceae bacterium]
MTQRLASVVLCAGKGTRMKSEKAKVLHTVLGRPLCAYPLSRALELGANPVVPVVGHQAEAVEKSIRAEFPEANFKFAVQAEQKGTGHAVRCAEAALEGYDGAVLILYGDTPLLRSETLQALVDAFHKGQSKLACITTIAKNPQGYGRVIRKNGKVAYVREQKDCNAEEAAVNEVNAGIYVVDAKFLFESLSKLKPQNAQGEYYLTDLVEMAAKQGDVPTVVADFEDTAGVNDKAELAEVARVLRLRINTKLMKAGVSIEDPATAFIDERAVIGGDSEIGPMVSIVGNCRIGKNVRIGQGCVLMSSEVSDGTEVKAYSVFEDARVGNGCIIGPFSRLRPGTELSEGVHIGNFVETKKARIGKGSKANHLAYLGDAKIGAGVNVGAGTITCNYDGKNKHTTELGDNVFIGSDTQLVAPVKVGEGAYVGAGTTVTKDVPPMSLAVSRTPQTNVEGWVAKKKARDAAKASSNEIKNPGAAPNLT